MKSSVPYLYHVKSHEHDTKCLHTHTQTNTQVLIIDEASMLSGEMFECLEQKLREIRNYPDHADGDPAGGLQLIVCGDFFQLPPGEQVYISWSAIILQLHK